MYCTSDYVQSLGSIDCVVFSSRSRWPSLRLVVSSMLFFFNVLENSKLQKRLKELSMDGTEEGERRKFYDQLDLGFHDP